MTEGKENEEKEINEYLKEQLLALGLSTDAIIEALQRIHLVCKGKVYGHAHIEDVSMIAYQALDVQSARSITLKVSKESDDEYDSHLDIQVIDVDEGGEKDGTDSQAR